SAPTGIYPLSYTTLFRSINKLWVLKSISDNFFETSLQGPLASESTKAIAFSSSVFDSMTRNLSSSFSSTIRKLQVGSMLISVKRSEEHTSELQSRENLVC